MFLTITILNMHKYLAKILIVVEAMLLLFKNMSYTFILHVKIHNIFCIHKFSLLRNTAALKFFISCVYFILRWILFI